MFLIQDGHQTFSHVGPALDAGIAEGVIWSPGDHTSERLEERVQEVASSAVAQAIDPQMYVAPLQDANPKRLSQHDLFPVPMSPRDYASRRLSAAVAKSLDLQVSLPVTHVLSPTVSVSQMTDRSAQVALSLAETSIDDWQERNDGRPLIVTSAVNASLLADPASVNSLLDELTDLDVEGFYLLFEIDPRSDPTQQDALLAEALYIVYTLAVVNAYDVWVGYAGLTGYLYRAVGATAFAAGFFQKQQWWSTRHWTGSGGGRQPRPRITLASLLGSLLVEAELRPVLEQRRDRSLGTELLTGAGELAAAYRTTGRTTAVEADRAAQTRQLFAVCDDLDSRITGDVARDIRRVREDITVAEGLHDRIDDTFVTLEQASAGRHLSVWRTALTSFVDRAGITI